MNIDSTTTPEANEAAIKTAADNLIRQAAAKNGLTFEQVPQEAKDDAYRFAKAAFDEDQAIKSNPVYAQLQAEREAHKLTQMELQAVRQSRAPVGNDTHPAIDPHVKRMQMGENQWHALTDNGRLGSCGIDPATVTDVERLEAKKLFGRQMDSHYSSNFFKQSPGRYRHLKAIAIILGIQGQ